MEESHKTTDKPVKPARKTKKSGEFVVGRE